MCITQHEAKRIRLYCRLVWEGFSDRQARRIAFLAYPPKMPASAHQDVTD